MKLLKLVLGPSLLAFSSACPSCQSEQSKKKSEPEAVSTQEKDATDTKKISFFSVPWGCVQVDKSKLEAAAYTIKDYKTSPGACPSQINVVDQKASLLLTCAITIGPPAVPATYILYEKRTLDGKEVSDLKALGFSVSNFCPTLAQKKFN